MRPFVVIHCEKFPALDSGATYGRTLDRYTANTIDEARSHAARLVDRAESFGGAPFGPWAEAREQAIALPESGGKVELPDGTLVVIIAKIELPEGATHEHVWQWVETELGGEWGTPGKRHYECSCSAWKEVEPDGRKTITPPEEQSA